MTFLEMLRLVLGDRSRDRIASSLADNLWLSSGVKGPPFDPWEFAHALNVPVRYAAIDAEGLYTHRNSAAYRGLLTEPSARLSFDGNDSGPVILLRRRDLSERKNSKRERFTLAHEIGHCVIRAALSAVCAEESLESENQDEEILCNLFAEHLLMPTRLISQDLATIAALTPQGVIDLSKRYAVSLQAMACRITRIFYGKVGVIIWRRTNERYSVKWASNGLYRKAVLCDTNRTTVEIAGRSRGVINGVDQILVEGRRSKWISVSASLNSHDEVLSVMRRSDSDLERIVRFRCKKAMRQLPAVDGVTQLIPVQLSLAFE